MSFGFVQDYLPQLLRGGWITLSLWFGGSLLGLVAAILVGTAAAADNRFVRTPAAVFVTLIRGTPLLVQVYIYYYGLGTIFAQIPEIRQSAFWPIFRDGYWYALFALVVHAAAYGGEVLRGAMRSVPKGEIEASAALGLNRAQRWWLIVLPRALGIALPALGGECIILLKGTVLASTIAVMDLLGMANFIRMQTFKVYEPLLGVALVYVLLTLLLTRALDLLERRVRH